MTKREFYLDPEDIKDLIKPMGYSIASNLIALDGHRVGFMYREEPFDEEDSGWRFLNGSESDEYLDDDANSKAISVNAIANIDQAIIPYLNSEEGTELERLEGTDEFIPYHE